MIYLICRHSVRYVWPVFYTFFSERCQQFSKRQHCGNKTSIFHCLFVASLRIYVYCMHRWKSSSSSGKTALIFNDADAFSFVVHCWAEKKKIICRMNKFTCFSMNKRNKYNKRIFSSFSFRKVYNKIMFRSF